MNNKLIIIVTFSLVYMLFEILIALRGNKKVVTKGDKGSFRVITIAITAGYWLSYAFAWSRIGLLHPWNTYFYTGFTIVITGLAIRISSIIILNKYFTSTITRVEDHKLIEKGLYSIIRHPAYLGQLIIFLGISMALSNWLSIIGMMLPVLAGYLYRISSEEKFMLNQFGDEYSAYQKKTKKLIPFIF
jgi:protein-S-isoprenylcysteine O-methyltransferase Ste14